MSGCDINVWLDGENARACSLAVFSIPKLTLQRSQSNESHPFSSLCCSPPAFLDLVPLKITLDMVSRRNSFDFCSPSTQRIASTTLDLPEPLGPTIPMTSYLKLMIVSFAKLLNPLMLSCFNLIAHKNRKKRLYLLSFYAHKYFVFPQIACFFVDKTVDKLRIGVNLLVVSFLKMI